MAKCQNRALMSVWNLSFEVWCFSSCCGPLFSITRTLSKEQISSWTFCGCHCPVWGLEVCSQEQADVCINHVSVFAASGSRLLLLLGLRLWLLSWAWPLHPARPAVRGQSQWSSHTLCLLYALKTFAFCIHSVSRRTNLSNSQPGFLESGSPEGEGHQPPSLQLPLKKWLWEKALGEQANLCMGS